MAITAMTTVSTWRTVAGSTVVHLSHDSDGTWAITAEGDTTTTALPATVVQADAIATCEQYAVLLETAVVAEQDARTSRAAARTYISTAPSRLANQPQ